MAEEENQYMDAVSRTKILFTNMMERVSYQWQTPAETQMAPSFSCVLVHNHTWMENILYLELLKKVLMLSIKSRDLDLSLVDLVGTYLLQIAGRLKSSQKSKPKSDGRHFHSHAYIDIFIQTLIQCPWGFGFA